MKKGRYQKTSPKKIPIMIPIVLTIILLALLLILLLKGCNGAISPSSNATESTAATAEKNPDSIAIPGYEMLELKADIKQQSLCLPNPPQNCCYFQISLYLEDGTLLWLSDLIEPGKTSAPMMLSKVLEKGMYPNAILKYSCFRMDESLSPLNGAETKVTLWVK